MTKNALRLLGLLPSHPRDFAAHLSGRMAQLAETLRNRDGSYDAVAFETAAEIVGNTLGVPVADFLDDQHARELAIQIEETQEQISSENPFPLELSADLHLARFSYALCRAMKPSVIVETGVAYGMTSAFILKALSVNGSGTLHSIDLPPLAHNADHFVGILVPEALRRNWILRRGTSRRILPLMLRELGRVDAFVHDSLHTRWNIRRELDIVTPYLGRQAFVLADDVDGNSAFASWVDTVLPTLSTTVREAAKKGLFGAAVFASDRPSV